MNISPRLPECLLKRADEGKRMENGTAGVCRILACIVITLLFFACILFIWHNSMEDAAESSERSGKVTEVINAILEQSGKEAVTEHFVRKLAHFSEYGMEGVLTVLLFVVYCLKLTKYRKEIVLTGLLTAVIDESIQFFSAGRAPGIGDVGIDMAGFFCGALFMAAAYRLTGKAKTWLRNRNRKKSFVS